MVKKTFAFRFQATTIYEHRNSQKMSLNEENQNFVNVATSCCSEIPRFTEHRPSFDSWTATWWALISKLVFTRNNQDLCCFYHEFCWLKSILTKYCKKILGMARFYMKFLLLSSRFSCLVPHWSACAYVYLPIYIRYCVSVYCTITATWID